MQGRKPLDRVSTRGRSVLVHAVLAVVTYVPLLLTRPGRVSIDTKQYLYLDPDRFMSRAVSLWDPAVHLGTVTHQNIGLIFPMGTWFWLAEHAGLPTWVAQRLWLGSILFAAGAGVLYLARTLRWTGVGPAVAALLYCLSPYVVQYGSRTSVLLLAFAGLPWLLGLTERALRARGWRHPALFALVAVSVGAVNATSLVLVGIAPLLWMVWSIWVARDTPWRAGLWVAARIGVLAGALSAFWVVALMVQGEYGLPVLSYTETIDQVATTALPTEILRGLGHWLFYGREGFVQNVAGAVAYLQNPGLLAVSLLLPTLAFAAACCLRWRHRGFFVALVVVGVFVAVGTYPAGDPSPVGEGFQQFASESTVGLALRSTTRAAPLVVLGFAVLLGVALTALARRSPRLGIPAAALVACLAIVNLPPLFTGALVDPGWDRPEDVPEYWQDALVAVDERPHDTRVLEIPGIQFSAYRWGTTYEPITPGLIDRPMVAREQIPFGSPASADLLIALDRRMQEGTFEPDALPPMARLLSAGDVLLRSDLAFERYLAPRPTTLWRQLDPPPDGLDDPVTFGEPVPNEPEPPAPLLDEQALAQPPAADPPPVAVFGVDDPRPIVRAESAARPLLLDGDGDGMVDAATVGLLDGAGTILYGASLDDAEVAAQLERGGAIVVTDTNRKRERRWRSTRANTGYTERVDEVRDEPDEGEADLDLFPTGGTDSQTVVEHRGAVVEATRYGGPVIFEPDARPAAAFDGDPRTAWQVTTLGDPVDDTLTVRLDEPVTTDHLELLQRQTGVKTFFVTEVELRFDGGEPVRVPVDAASREEPGQRVTFPERTFSELELTITGTEVSPEAEVRGISPVGFAEIRIPGLSFEETTRLPVGLVEAAGTTSIDHPLVFVTSRLRSNPAESVRGDEEQSMSRVLDVPVGRDFTFLGTARLSAYATDDVLDDLLGLPAVEEGGVTATSSARLPGDRRARASATIDGDPATHWSPPFLNLEGTWLRYELPAPLTVDHLDLALVADGRHSVPTRVRIESDDGTSRTVDLPAVDDRAEPDATVPVDVTFPPLTGSTFTVTVEDVRTVETIDAYTRLPIPQPIAIAEIGLPGVTQTAPVGAIATPCRDDLVSVDGRPIPVRMTGEVESALQGDGLALESCTGPVALDAGEHTVRTTQGRDTGIDVDRVALGSDAGGTPLPLAGRALVLPAAPEGPDVEVLEQSATVVRARVRGTDPGSPFWMVLGESHNAGWEIDVDGGQADRSSQVVDGYANGWSVTPDAETVEITMRWSPQASVDRALLASGLVAIACLVLVAVGRRWRPTTEPPGADAPGLAWPFRAVPPMRGWGSRLSVAATIAVVAGLLVTPIAAVPVGAIVLVAAAWPRGRAVLVSAAFTLLVVAFAWAPIARALDPKPPDYTWIRGFATPSRLALVAVLLLAADAVLSFVRGRQGLPDTVAAPRRVRAAATGLAARRRFTIGGGIGALAAALVFTWMLTAGTFELTRWQRVGDFYDAQAHSLLDGHLTIDREVLGIEAFTVDGRSYMYQGPAPALLRLPVAAVTDSLDGRLAPTSMLLAFTVAMVFLVRLQWRVRGITRGDAPVGSLEPWVVGAFTFLVGAGSTLLFVASRAWVYHESVMWGVAWALAAFDALLAWRRRPRLWLLAVTALLTTLAMLSRASIGIGPLAALGLVAAGTVIGVLRDRARRRGRWRRLLPVIVAAAVPVIVYAAINFAKFGSLFSVPFDAQAFSAIDPARQQFIEENGPSFFGLQFVPTTLWQYLRPDGLSFTRVFPFVEFPVLGTSIGGVRFDLIDHSASIPGSLPALCVLALGGLVAVVSPRRARVADRTAELRVVVAGAFVGALAIFPFGYVAQRYLADTVPFLALAGMVGVQVLVGRLVAIPRPRWAVAAAVALGALAAFGVWTNLALGLWYQRALSPSVDETVAEGLVSTQAGVQSTLFGDRPLAFRRGDVLPDRGTTGELFVVGDCEGLYVSDGLGLDALRRTNWNPVDRGNAAGRYVLDVTVPGDLAAEGEPILAAGTGARPVLLVVRPDGDDVVFELRDGDQVSVGRSVHVERGEAVRLDVALDHNLGTAVVEVGDVEALRTFFPRGERTQVRLGVDPWGTPATERFTGRIENLPVDTDLCRRVVSPA